MKDSYIIQVVSLLALIPFSCCGSDHETTRKDRWFRPKNDRSNVPVEAYHPDIPDQVEVPEPQNSLKSSRSQYLPKHTYDPSAPFVTKPADLDQSQTKKLYSPINTSRTSIPLAVPNFRTSKSHEPKSSKMKDAAGYERQDFEWKYTSLLIDQLFDHLLMREEDEHTCALLIQEKNYLLRIVTYKG